MLTRSIQAQSTEQLPPSLFSIFDQEQWRRVVKKHALAPFADFNEFINNAPRDIILVINKKNENSRTPEINTLQQNTNDYLTPYGFQIKRVVTLNFVETGVLSLDKFKSIIL